ncbi:hypothetical protein AB0O18_33860 [Streptomyces sp. NPDC093224]|uniref:hypothetical protein n=1 Tax=Streptomyces sp. NPDC093224 TaxID=3155198 RepID=UPI00344ADCB9
MIWWSKARAAQRLAAVTALTIGLGLLLGDTALPIPILTGQSGTFLAGHLLTVLPAVVLMYGKERTDHRLEATAARPVNRWDAGLAALTATSAAAVAGLLYLLLDADIAVVTGRNIAAYIGIAACISAFLGPRIAAFLTTVVPLGLAHTGWTPVGKAEIWAWLLHDADSATAIASTVITLMAGLFSLWLRRGPISLTIVRAR